MSAVGVQELPARDTSDQSARRKARRLPRINFRPLLFAAVGCVTGVYLYLRIAFGGFVPSDALFVTVFCALLVLRPKRGAIAAAILFIAFAGLGAGLAHWERSRFAAGMPEGEYAVTGTVQSAAVQNGRTTATLVSLTLDGTPVAGKMSVTFASEEVAPADILSFTAAVGRSPLPDNGDVSAEYAYSSGVRYTASAGEFYVAGRSANPFLRLNAALRGVLYENMDSDSAGVAYALLTGNSRGMDGSFLAETRTGGIAHAFAVSGLHIGILYAAAMFLFRPLRRYAFLPAIALAACYSALCAFTVSSVRAVLMCAALGGSRFFGRKYDLLSSVSFAGLVTLLIAPAQIFTAGFRLSYGAVLGLALFSGSFMRGLRRLHVPAFLANYLAASAAVQIFTFPVMAEAFGYISVWGMLLNFFVIPALPVLFLPLIVCALFALCIPAAASVFLALPSGMIAALLFVFSAADFSAVLTGFSLGAGGAVWLVGTVILSGRVRLGTLARGVAAGTLCIAFIACMVWENAVFSGCKIVVYEYGQGACALVRTSDCAVLVIDDDISLSACEDFLMRTYGGELDAVAVTGEDTARAVNVAAFLPAREVRVRTSQETGFRETNVLGGVRFEYGGLSFRYEGNALTLSAEGVLVKFDFSDERAFGADLFVQTGDGDLKYLLKNGIIREIKGI